MKVKYTQKQPWGCGLYAVANVCNLDNYITEERLGQSNTGNGNTIGQLSKWLQEDGLPYNIEALYYNQESQYLPDYVINCKPSGEGILGLPILIAVNYSENSLNHLIGGQIDLEGKLYLFDSLKEDVVITTLQEVNDMYHSVYGVYVFVDITNGSYAFLM